MKKRKFHIYDRGPRKIGDKPVTLIKESLPYLGIARMALHGKSNEEIDKIIESAIKEHEQKISEGYQPTLEGYIPRVK